MHEEDIRFLANGDLHAEVAVDERAGGRRIGVIDVCFG
jgi:hypothetical protein